MFILHALLLSLFRIYTPAPAAIEARLSGPQSRDQFSDADIVCLERVKSNAKSNGTDAKSPVRQSTNLGNALLGEVVDDTSPEEY